MTTISLLVFNVFRTIGIASIYSVHFLSFLMSKWTCEWNEIEKRKKEKSILLAYVFRLTHHNRFRRVLNYIVLSIIEDLLCWSHQHLLCTLSLSLALLLCCLVLGLQYILPREKNKNNRNINIPHTNRTISFHAKCVHHFGEISCTEFNN